MVEIAGGRFLIVGGASYSGSHITDQLLAAGAAHVVLFDNNSLNSSYAIEHLVGNPAVSVFKGDMLRLESLMEAADGVDGIFAVAAYLAGPMAADMRQGLDVNIHGIRNVLETCRLRKIPRLVYSSSVGVYGNATQLDRIEENTPLITDGMGSVMTIYSATKVIGENLCRFYGDTYGIEWAALRYSSIYGPRQHGHSINALPVVTSYEALSQGQRPVIYGDGDDVHDYIYVGDLAAANLKAMAASGSGAATVVSGRARSVNDIVRIMSARLGVPFDPEYRNPEGRLAFTKSTHLQYVRDRARDMWGWEPLVELEEGIDRYVEWREGKRLHA